MNIFQKKYHKRLLIIGVVTLAGILLAGCMAPQFTYQGVLTDGSGNPLNGSVTFTYRIFNDDTGGTLLYEQDETVDVTDGRFDSVVGPDSVVSGLTPSDLAQPLWIEVQVDNGTYNETLSPRQKLYGAPYAFTLMPGAVISSTMDATLVGGSGVDAVLTVQNMETGDPLPALRVVGEQGIELVDVSGSHGTIYSDLGSISSDIYMYSNDDFAFFLDNDVNDATSEFWVYGDPTTNYCRIRNNGSLYCTGTVTWGGSMVNGENRSLYAVQSPEVRIEDFGSAQLENGQTAVQIDSLFAKTVNLDDYHVFLTPLGDCNGLYVTNKTATSFEVHELGGGTSEISFDYRIVAKRAGYENHRMEVVPTGGEGLGE